MGGIDLPAKLVGPAERPVRQVGEGSLFPGVCDCVRLSGRLESESRSLRVGESGTGREKKKKNEK